MQLSKSFLYICYPIGLICFMTAWTIMAGQFAINPNRDCNCGDTRALRFSPESQLSPAKMVLPIGFNESEYVREIKEETFEPDEWDSSEAIGLLREYNSKLNHDVQPLTVDLRNLSTVTEWWQAAAMIHWYLTGPVRASCDPSKLVMTSQNWGVCQQDPWIVRKDCLIYASVATKDFTMPDYLTFQGCYARLFLPNIAATGSDNKRRTTVYEEGIGATYSNTFMSEDGTPLATRTLKDIRHRLGHDKRIIDLLLIDFMGTEFDVLNYLMETELTKRIRHLLVRYHLRPPFTPKENFVNYFRIMTRLRHLGFREYYTGLDSNITHRHRFNLEGRVAYVNTHFDWFI